MQEAGQLLAGNQLLDEGGISNESQALMRNYMSQAQPLFKLLTAVH